MTAGAGPEARKCPLQALQGGILRHRFGDPIGQMLGGALSEFSKVGAGADRGIFIPGNKTKNMMNATPYDEIRDPLAKAATFILEESKSARPAHRTDVMFGVSWLINDREGGWGDRLRKMAEEHQDLEQMLSRHVAGLRNQIPSGVEGIALRFMFERLENAPLVVQTTMINEPLDIGFSGYKFCQKTFDEFESLKGQLCDFEHRFDTFIYQIRKGGWDLTCAEARAQAEAAGASPKIGKQQKVA